MNKESILVVEDEAIIAKDLQLRLEKMGYSVPLTIATGEDAISKAHELKPDLVLMDIMLRGDMDGIEAAKEISSRDDIPIIYLSSYSDDELLERAKNTKPLAYMIKPVGDRELYSGIMITLNKHKMERQLKENEKWLSTLLASIGDALTTTDMSGNVVFMNHIAELLTGWNKEEAVGRPIEMVCNIINERTGESIENPVRKVLDKSQFDDMDANTALISKNGTIIPVDDSTAPIRDVEGNVIGVVMVLSDISERRHSEEAILKSNEKIGMLLNSTAEAIYGLDLDGNCTFCNPSCLRLLGYENEKDLLGKNMHKLIHHTRIDNTAYPVEDCRMHEALNQGKEVHVDNEVLWRADGSSFYVEYRCHPMYSNTEIIGAVVTFLDITSNKQDKKFIQNILESVGEGFIVIDKDYKILSANRAFCEYVKRPLADVVGKYCYEVSHYKKQRCYEGGEDCPVKYTYETGDTRSVVHSHYDKDGKTHYTEVRSYAMKNESGECVSVIEIINDISEKKKLESQLYHAQKMEAVGLLAGGVAHDFNNILTAISGYGNLIKMKSKEDDKISYNINQVLASVKRGANLTHSLLAFSRKEAINPMPVNFNMIVENVYKLLQRLIGEDIELKQVLTKEDVTVMADIGQVEQILMNFATNARDAMPNGGSITIETEVTELDDQYIKNRGFGTPGKYVLVSITDTGVGMDEETKEKIFEPFFTTKEVGKGTGLGLSMIYGIVKQHDGYIDVYSRPGEGTTFKIYIPLIKAVIKKTRQAEKIPSYGGTETILFAEDDTDARNLTKTVLLEFGYNVIETKSGQEAIDEFIENKDRIQLLVLDVIMPHKSGREAYDEIMKMRPDIKTIFISGYTADIIKRKGVLEENLNFISKPYTPQEILIKVREVLDEKCSK